MILSDFAKQFMQTLIAEMQAVTPNGDPDHKTRMASLKEARAFIQSLLPKLSQSDREDFSHVLTSEMADKLTKIEVDEQRLTKPTDQVNSHQDQSGIDDEPDV